MKVLQVHNVYNHTGGEEVVVEKEKKLLESAGDTVVQYLVHNEASMGGVDKIKSSIDYSFSYFSKKEYLNELLAVDPDVVHFHNVFPRMGTQLFRYTKKHGYPTVLTLHNYRYSCSNGLFLRQGGICHKCLDSPSVIRPVVSRCYRDSVFASAVVSAGITMARLRNDYSHLDCIVVMTDFAKRLLVRSGIDEARIVVKPHSVVEVQNGLEGKKYDFCYAGRLSSEKGVDELIEALKMLPRSTKTLIVGDGQQRAELEFAAQELNVDFVGWKESVLVSQYISSSKFLIFPSRWYETFGLTIIEAMSLGVPVIARSIGGVPELFESNELMFDDLNSLVVVLQKVLTMTDGVYEEHSRFVKSLVVEKYSDDRNVKMLKSIYQEISNTPKN